MRKPFTSLALVLVVLLPMIAFSATGQGQANQKHEKVNEIY